MLFFKQKKGVFCDRNWVLNRVKFRLSLFPTAAGILIVIANLISFMTKFRIFVIVFWRGVVNAIKGLMLA